MPVKIDGFIGIGSDRGSEGRVREKLVWIVMVSPAAWVIELPLGESALGRTVKKAELELPVFRRPIVEWQGPIQLRVQIVLFQIAEIAGRLARTGDTIAAGFVPLSGVVVVKETRVRLVLSGLGQGNQPVELEAAHLRETMLPLYLVGIQVALRPIQIVLAESSA